MNSEQWIVWLSLFSRRSNRPEIVEPTEVTCWNIGSFNMLKPSCVIWMESSQFFLEAIWMLLLFWTLFHSYLLPLGQLLLRPQKMHVAWSFCPSATRSSLGSFGSAQTNVKCQQMSTHDSVDSADSVVRLYFFEKNLPSRAGLFRTLYLCPTSACLMSSAIESCFWRHRTKYPINPYQTCQALSNSRTHTEEDENSADSQKGPHGKCQSSGFKYAHALWSGLSNSFHT